MRSIVLLVCCCSVFVGQAYSAERNVTETRLAAFPPEVRDSAVVSPDCRRIAYIKKLAEGEMLVVDGQDQPMFKQVASITFSPDSKHFAYAAAEGKTWKIVANARPQSAFSRVGPPQFSPDGRRLTYVAQTTDGRRTVVVNGTPGRPCDEVFQGLLVFSPNGRRLAYGALIGQRWHVVVDDQPGEPCEFLGSTTGINFSPDGNRLAYAALIDGKWKVVVDGQSLKEYENIGNLAFSPDGRSLAYTAQSGGKWRVVLDNDEGPPYDAVAAESLRFSPDGARLVYVAQSGGRWQVVVHEISPTSTTIGAGVASKPYDKLGLPVFSPDGKRLAYCAGDAKQMFMVLDGKEGSAFERIGGLSVSFIDPQESNATVIHSPGGLASPTG